ncbi:HlyIII-domain-containing protein [Agrocybe pediades]|nr:HlyIII-domain-containing protein [Agrocybe pediades]
MSRPASLIVTGHASSYADPLSIRTRRTRRRLSAPSSTQPPLKICNSLSYSLEALDLSFASPTQTLASLRFLVLSYLADLERRLAEFESPTFDTWKLPSEITIEEATQWARTALEMLEGIRADVCSHLPELPFADMESFVKSHLPEMPDVPILNEMRSHLPDMAEMRSHIPSLPDTMAEMRSHMPNMDDVRSHISDMRHKLDDVRTRFQLDFDFKQPFSYIPTLSDHLENLHSHLSSVEIPTVPSFTPNTVISDLLESLLNSDVVKDILNSHPEEVIAEGEDLLERAALEVKLAVQRSLEGAHLIRYSDLPKPWRNNPFVTHGYRFIPIERWPLIVMSLFSFHNETLNIHTHLIPFLLWGINLIPYIRNPGEYDVPELLFMAFALLCLCSSALWHTMSGCADHRSMEFCARVDYVGIGWLISASVGTVVHYGFACNPRTGHAFLGLCFATGLAGNLFPFMSWFNKHEYRFYRIGFFLTLAFSGIGPMVALSMLHSRREALDFVGPMLPSLLSYLIGLTFYAAHFPERIIPPRIQFELDKIGGGSHAIWHCFIVLAVSQHKAAMQSMKEGLQCLVSP